MRRLITAGLSFCLAIALILYRPHPWQAQTIQSHLAMGSGGAVASVDESATQVGIDVLRAGGNAVDAAVATAAALGVTEPFSAGIGGGGFMLIYQPAQSSSPSDAPRLVTLDGREEAPAAVGPDLFRNPDSLTGEPLPFFPNRISSGLAVGVPGTPLNWATAVERYGTKPLPELLQPAIALAENGFPVDETFVGQITANQARFSAFDSTRSLYLPNGQPPAVGSQFTNPDLANTYRLLASQGVNAFYRGEIASAIAQTVQNPPVVTSPNFRVWPGQMTLSDLDRYEIRVRPAVETTYRDHILYSMGLPSSGGTTIAQTLNLLEGYELSEIDRTEALHQLIEAERLAFADRGAYIGDPEYVDVPLPGLLSKDYANERRTEIPEDVPVDERAYRAIAGNPLSYQQDPSPSLTTAPVSTQSNSSEGLSTTHLTVVDADGMIVSYTLTIESTGGSGIVVPGYGFILNNELTDFDVENPHPNVPESGKRPRSSMAPTIMIAPDDSLLAFGSPGGSTIITTGLNIATNIVDFGLSLEDAIAAPRLSQRNDGITQVDQNFEETEQGQALISFGHQLNSVDEIGAATGVLLRPNGQITAVAEPVRRGGGSAMTVE